MKPDRYISTEWSNDLAYIVGLVTADGCLDRDGRHVVFTSADLELIEKYKTVLGVSNKITEVSKRVFGRRPYYYISIAQKSWYEFLVSIGLHPAKSKTIKSVNIPDQFFGHFLRGLYDGDGCFYTSWDRRWPRAFRYQFEFPSASSDFVLWLQDRLAGLYDVKGVLKSGKGVMVIRFLKNDSRLLFDAMYDVPDCLHLERKYVKILDAFSFDAELKKQKATVA